MPLEVRIPDLSEAGESLTLVHWYKKEGEAVKEGESLFDVETGKATLNVEALAGGILIKILVPVDQEVVPGQAVAILKLENEVETGLVPDQQGELSGKLTYSPAAALENQDEKQAATRALRPFASPKARRIALEKGISLEGMTGSGVDGMIIEGDLVEKNLLL